MIRNALSTILLLFSIIVMGAKEYSVIVADSVTHIPLPNATIYDRDGNPIGLSDKRGGVSVIERNLYPITISYLGYDDSTVMFGVRDTVFLTGSMAELPEVTVETRGKRMLHILAYVRDFSTLTTYTDTVFLFREKMVDYMLPTDKKVNFKGWSSPRILSCKSYYRFTNQNGLDSVSDSNQNHFSWSDWVGIPSTVTIPSRLVENSLSTDTLYGKFGRTETWSRDDNKIALDIDVLADTASRKWVPGLKGFFRHNLEYEKFELTFNYSNIAGDTVSPLDLDGYSISIESNGRGHDMFRFNKVNEPFFVDTQADIYILDKEYITVKEAKKWDRRDFGDNEIAIFEPLEAPPLSEDVENLIARVNLLDKEQVRLDVTPDQRLVSVFYDSNYGSKNFRIGNRALSILKTLTGISQYKFHKNTKMHWNELKLRQLEKQRKK